MRAQKTVARRRNTGRSASSRTAGAAMGNAASLAETFVGVAAHCRPHVQKQLGYRKTEVGIILFTAQKIKPARDVRRIVVAGVVCPYCRGPVSRLDPRDGRIQGRVIAVTPHPKEDRNDVVLDPIPSTHWAVLCVPCRAQFVMPTRVPLAIQSMSSST